MRTFDVKLKRDVFHCRYKEVCKSDQNEDEEIRRVGGVVAIDHTWLGTLFF